MSKAKAKKIKVPKRGAKIYVGSHYYIDHGADDVEGGVATVTEVRTGVSAGEETPFVSVKEHPGNSYNWEMLSKEQAKLRKEFGRRKAHPCPDYRDYGPWDK